MTNNSTGDQLSYQWTVSPAGGVTFDNAIANAFDYGERSDRAVHDHSGGGRQSGVRPGYAELRGAGGPAADGGPVADRRRCETTVLTPVVAYTTDGYIDEVMSGFTGGTPATSDEFSLRGYV
ncbi:MAG: hypothetical protein IPH04_19870 [Saprospirales bacterium]|nr:hypothetical protein [Saprospirales bacterium]